MAQSLAELLQIARVQARNTARSARPISGTQRGSGSSSTRRAATAGSLAHKAGDFDQQPASQIEQVNFGEQGQPTG